MHIYIRDDGEICTKCTDCGSEMVCLTECLPKADFVQFQCKNEKCGKVISILNPKDWEPLPSA